MDIIFLYLQFFRQTADTTTTCCFPSLFQIWLLHDLGSEAEAFTAHNFSASQISGIFIRKNRRGCCWLVTLQSLKPCVVFFYTTQKSRSTKDSWPYYTQYDTQYAEFILFLRRKWFPDLGIPTNICIFRRAYLDVLFMK